jgi:hypothetical protein
MKSRLVFTARGELLVTELDGCWDSEEINAIDDYEVPVGTTCDICGEPIEEPQRGE